jgi:hypothetical protein
MQYFKELQTLVNRSQMFDAFMGVEAVDKLRPEYDALVKHIEVDVANIVADAEVLSFVCVCLLLPIDNMHKQGCIIVASSRAADQMGTILSGTKESEKDGRVRASGRRRQRRARRLRATRGGARRASNVGRRHSRDRSSIGLHLIINWRCCCCMYV